MEIEQHAPEKPMSQRRNQKKKFKNIWKQMKMDREIPKYMGGLQGKFIVVNAFIKNK